MVQAPLPSSPVNPGNEPVNVAKAAPKPLTGGRDAQYTISNILREKLCLLDDGRLLISQTHAENADVRGFTARLSRTKVSYAIELVEMAVVKEAYAGVTFQRRVVSSDMQSFAYELCKRAAKMHTSDIHILVSSRDGTKIFFRVHGDLMFVEEHAFEFGVTLCTTIYQAIADVSDATYQGNSIQDARISARDKIPEGTDGIRIATSPQVDGQIMVLRLLYNDLGDSIDPLSLGYTQQHAQAFEEMMRRPTGINIFCGPTGSGKSTTLQRMLRAIYIASEGKKHIITVEDPPEAAIPGVVQTPVTNADTAELRSAAFLRAISGLMRLDPDVIMIGETRDGPSARLAFQAAMTGHQVWTSLHANSAFAAINRLIDLGVPIEMVCDPEIVHGLICQRLVKILCDHCKVKLETVEGRYTASNLNRIKSLGQYSHIHVVGDGCEYCRMGIRGRTVVAETVVTDRKLMGYFRQRDMTGAYIYWREQLGGKTMMDHAIDKVREGRIDPFHAEQQVGPLMVSSTTNNAVTNEDTK